MGDEVLTRSPNTQNLSPNTPSDSFEVAIKLPAGDRSVVGRLLDARRVQVMLDDQIAEGRPSRLAPRQALDRLAQAAGDPGQVWRLVRIPDKRRWRLQSLLDAVQASGDRGREREVRVDVSTG